MGIYIILIAIAMSLVCLRNTTIYDSLDLRNLVMVTVTFILFCLTVFRAGSVGTDYPAYNAYFNLSSLALKNKYIESGYILLNTVAQTTGMFILIPATEFLVSYFGMYKLAVTTRVNLFSFISFYILTYTYMQSFNALRQFIAIGFISFAFSFLCRGKPKYLWFLVFTGLAYEFHSSSLVMLFSPLLLKINVNESKVAISTILTTILFITGLGVKLTQPLIAMNSHYVAKYGNDMSFLTSSGNKGIVQFLPILFQFVLFYLFLYFNSNREPADVKIYNFILSGYLIFLLLYSAGGNGVIDRIQMFFYVFSILANAYFIQRLDENFDRRRLDLVIYKVTVVLFWGAYCILRLMMNNADVVPYMFGVVA